jgi:peptidase E
MQKLFLASEAKHPKSLEYLKEFIGGTFKDKKITYIPTAMNGEFYGGWKGGQSIKIVHQLGAKINVVELESVIYKDIISEIAGSDIVWFAGGAVGYLLYWIRRTKLDKALPEILDSGTIYVGSSAGSMACSKTQFVGEWYIGESESGVSLIPGLGLVDFEIYPHYEDELKPQIEANWKEGQGKLYLLKNGDVITKVGEKVEVLGEEIMIEK